jgi:DNA (cytosine-5)-methyltransferase 1
MEPEEVLRIGGSPTNRIQDAIDVIIGGPPCQAFARIGRAKLREIGNHPEAFKRDLRAALYLRYLHYVRKTLPLALLIENVPDVLNFGGRNIAEEIVGHLKHMGYASRYTLLNAAHYGVPQARERMFLVGVHESCGNSFRFPEPTRSANLPSGYGHVRAVALGAIRLSGKSKGRIRATSFIAPPVPKPGLPAATTSIQGLSDLPEIRAHHLARSGKPLAFKELRGISYSYRCKPRNLFQRQMRNWISFPPAHGIFDHAIRFLPRDFQWFQRMRPGMRYPEIHSIALTTFFSKILPDLRKKRLPIPKLHTKAFDRFLARHVPPYDPGKFRDKWRMIDPDSPCHTLLAHLGKDCYSHIHFDRRQARTISIREAARLQSFPDAFAFPCGMNSSFRQIGNAVPPLLSFALAFSIRKALTGNSDGRLVGWVESGKEEASGAAGRARRSRSRKA